MSRVFKKRKLNGAKIYKPWKTWAKGDYVIGKLTGTSIDKYKKTSWHLELVEVQFADGTEMEEGKVIGLNSTALLDKVMEGVEIGEIVQVDYEGTETLTSGPYEGNDSHSVVISVLTEEDEGSSSSDDDGL